MKSYPLFRISYEFWTHVPSNFRVTEEEDAEKQTPLGMRLILSAHSIALYRLCPDDISALPNRTRCNSLTREKRQYKTHKPSFFQCVPNPRHVFVMKYLSYPPHLLSLCLVISYYLLSLLSSQIQFIIRQKSDPAKSERIQPHCR